MKRYVTALVGAVALATMGAGIGVASASVSRQAPDAVVGSLGDTTGTAGWYTNSFGETYNETTTTFTLPLTGIGTVTDPGALGGQLCNSNNGDVVDAGAVPETPATVSTPELYTVGFGWGTLTGDPTTNEDACDGNTFEASGGFTGLANNIPAGDSVQVRSQVVDHEYGGHSGRAGVWFYGEDTRGLANFSQFEAFGSDGFDVTGPFNEAAAGLSADQNTLGGAAVNPLSAFSNVSACTPQDGCHGFAFWNAVSVSSSANGLAPWLVTPTTLVNNSGARLCHLAWKNGFWGPWYDHHTKRTWHAGHAVERCTVRADVNSSFVIDAAGEIGL